MENQFTPTKANLMKAKESLSFSIKGYALLDKKRTVLIREAVELMDRASQMQQRVRKEFKEAYEALEIANITLGVNTVSDVAISINNDEDFDILHRSVMGLELPEVMYKRESKTEPSYGFYRTNVALDKAVKKMEEIRYLVYELAELENAMYMLSLEIKKTAKRANALDKIQIPRYQAAVKYITEVLEEKEREDFFRLKKIKSKKSES